MAHFGIMQHLISLNLKSFRGYQNGTLSLGTTNSTLNPQPYTLNPIGKQMYGYGSKPATTVILVQIQGMITQYLEF